MINKFRIVFGLVSLCLIIPLSYAEESAVNQWQKQRLFNPSEKILQYEKDKQQVFIYEGLKYADVEKAMDIYFDRLEHMMFVSTVLPPNAAGVEQKEQDGCE